ncbi:MAG: M1 family metallopeptidase [Ignavibacteriales bacterium]|nr:M1 family metallopeptidase [Ignavibacteriales bacterium]
MKQITILLFVFSFVMISFGQNNLKIPLNIKPAYEKGTRSLDGMPGKNYWQNKSEYNIKVNLDPKTKLLQGSEDIIYHNNSNDSLSQIVVRLYHNISKPNARRDFNLNENALTNGVQLKKIILDSKEIELTDKSISNVSGTNLILKLTEKLAPKTQLNFSIDWELSMPAVQSIRYGSYDSTTMFIAYWYPQVSVYDDIDGWDMLDYSGTLEMYNDFNDYNIEFNVPAGFQIWATGVWQNADEILNQKYFERYKAAWKSDDVVKIIEPSDLITNSIYQTTTGFHSLKFKAENVPDFAFGISDHYLWDAVSFTPDKSSDRRVYCAAAYNESSKDFIDVAFLAKEALKYFSYEIPAVPYPFPSATVFNGSGGMEYPMIVNNGSASTKSGTVHLTSHELCHQYLPFYMGTNERKYPFMDEGWAVMLPFDFQERFAEGYNPRERYVKTYEDFAGNEYDLPVIIPSPTMNYRSYRTSAYNKPANAYEILRKTLGDDLFLKALQTFMERWNGKHPIPTDFFFTFNEVTAQDLNWFWKPWFYDFNYPDISIEKVRSKKNSIFVKIKNIGGLPLPIKLQVMYNNEMIREIYKTAEVWKSGKDKIEVKINGVENFDAVILGSELIPDVNSIDNVYFK